MKLLYITFGLALSISAYAANTYKCGPFKDKKGLSLLDFKASITEGDREQLLLNIGKKYGVESVYELVSTNKGPVFNLYLYRAGPYKVSYNQDMNKFVIQLNAFSASCKEAR